MSYLWILCEGQVHAEEGHHSALAPLPVRGVLVRRGGTVAGPGGTGLLCPFCAFFPRSVVLSWRLRVCVGTGSGSIVSQLSCTPGIAVIVQLGHHHQITASRKCSRLFIAHS